MSASASHLQRLLQAHPNIRQLAAETGIGYFKLIRFKNNPEAPFQFVVADRLHAHLTGKPLIAVKAMDKEVA